MAFLVSVWRYFFRLPPKIYYVESDEPFTSKPILRGPFIHADALRLGGIQASCGCTNRMYVDKGTGSLVRV